MSFRFLDLPRELQDQIIGHILNPGQVHLEIYTGRWGLLVPRFEAAYIRLVQCLPWSVRVPGLSAALHLDINNARFPQAHYVKCGGSPTRQQPGYQVLATCRTMYEERYRLFYSRNVFHVPPGPILISFQYFKCLQPKHKALIERISVNFSAADLTPEGFLHVQEEVRRWEGTLRRNARPMDKSRLVLAWLDASMVTLNHLWREKTEWLLTWPALSEVEFCTDKPQVRLSGDDVISLFSITDRPRNMNFFWNPCTKLARKRLREQYEKCELKQVGKFANKVILETKPVQDWLLTQTLQIRCKP